MVNLTCENCKNPFSLERQVYNSRKNRKNLFCSAECRDVWQSKEFRKNEVKEVVCSVCKTKTSLPKKGGRYCAKCFSTYMSRRYNARKLACIEFLGNKCSDCKESVHPSSYHFHHTDPSTKEFMWNKLRLKSVEKVFKEIVKVVLLCANCHSKSHSDSSNWIGLDKEKNRFLEGLQRNKMGL